ncbi:hypothetical protein ATO6_00245 [Oceanicola sp. 22II-s10i]|uniref:hypothetical protein n=1 Tax=Oceanicola sp. 22II-s10i TaxID=1317116 RepID=UPI000B5243EC|nr:hypothetical protein [Oceanicola sp. 22II-s10i]OWU85425.1 hypothetical protein ATO6_00245 [Oceanicola sp. 22II-s10i]
MSDGSQSRPTPLGIYDRPKRSRMTPVESISLAVSLIWLAGSAFFFLLLRDPDIQSGTSFDSLRFVITLLAIFMPVAMIWVAATTARAARVMREESARLQAAIDAIRQAYLAQAQQQPQTAEPAVSKRLDEIAAAARKTETALATFTSHRDRTRPVRPAQPEARSAPQDDQAPLPLGTTAEDMAPPLDRGDFIRALNFPETAEDEEGFAALRRALKDRKAGQLVQASQDILTLLSHDGIYMDDLRPDMARPEVWRRFAEGTRGKPVAALGGIRDRSSLALTNGRMKQDPIFRDAAHHFLRLFDRNFQAFEQDATDAEISELGETRTARAFMLLGRVAGMFD